MKKHVSKDAGAATRPARDIAGADGTMAFGTSATAARLQRRHQQLADDSPRVKQLKHWADMAGQPGPAAGGVVQRLAIGKHAEYDGYLNGDGMLRTPAKVGVFVGMLRKGYSLPSGDDPMSAAMDVPMVATPDEEHSYVHADEVDGLSDASDDSGSEGEGSSSGSDAVDESGSNADRGTVAKNVLVTGHHRLAAYAEMGMRAPAIAPSTTYVMHGYRWDKLADAQYELKESDIVDPDARSGAASSTPATGSGYTDEQLRALLGF